jgi:hypothetical protein
MMSSTTTNNNKKNVAAKEDAKPGAVWRGIVLAKASEEVRSFFDSMSPGDQANTVYEALFFVLEDEEFKALLFHVRFGRKDDSCFDQAMDKFVRLLPSKDLSRVSSLVIVSLMKAMKNPNRKNACED